MMASRVASFSLVVRRRGFSVASPPKDVLLTPSALPASRRRLCLSTVVAWRIAFPSCCGASFSNIDHHHAQNGRTADTVTPRDGQPRSPPHHARRRSRGRPLGHRPVPVRHCQDAVADGQLCDARKNEPGLVGGFGSAGRDQLYVERDAVPYPSCGAEWAGGRAGAFDFFFRHIDIGIGIGETDCALAVSRDPCRGSRPVSVPLPLDVGVPLPLDARLLAPPAAIQWNAHRVGPEGGEVVPPRARVGRLCEGDQADRRQFVCRQRGDH